MSVTSASIGRHREIEIARALSRRARASAAVRAVLATTVMAFAGSAAALTAVTVEETRAVASCVEARDRVGLGQHSGLRALEEPNRQSRWLYRVTGDVAGGYRAVVVVKSGPFAGDTWERDATGRVRHTHDVCRDRGDARWAALF